MNSKLLALALFCFVNLYPNKAIIIMGSSCSGKSTVAKNLLKALKGNWKLIELDEIEEDLKRKGLNCDDNKLIDELITKSNEALSKGQDIVIDTNIHDAKFDNLKADYKKIVLVYAPIDILLERDAKRTLILKRDAKKADGARKYVISTFNKFSNLKGLQKYDLLIESNLITVSESVNKIID